MEIRFVKGMYRLKLVSSENNSGFKGLILPSVLAWSMCSVGRMFFDHTILPARKLPVFVLKGTKQVAFLEVC